MKNLNNNELVSELKSVVKKERILVAQMISYLQEVSERKLFTEYKVNSLHKFCTRILGMSDAEAALRCKAVFVISKLPEVKREIENNTVNLTAASHLLNFIKENPKEDAKAALDKIKGKTAKASEQILREISPNPPAPKVIITLKGSFLTKTQKLMKHYGVDSEFELLQILVDEKERELKFAVPRRRERGSKNQRYISRAAAELVFKRDDNQCTKCQSRTYIELDHVKKIAIGGQSSADNLRLLCRNCNQARNYAS